MKLILLGKPPIILDHEKAVLLKNELFKGTPLQKLEKEHELTLSIKKSYMLVS